MWPLLRRALGGWGWFPPGATPPTVPFDGPVVFTCRNCGDGFTDNDQHCPPNPAPVTNPPPGSGPPSPPHA